jgi:ArsR family transcriptional regulator
MNKNKSIIIFKALSEETRFLIIEALLKKESCACEIPKIIKRTQSNTSMHLSKLQDLNLIKSRKDGKMVLYSVVDKDLMKIMELIK